MKFICKTCGIVISEDLKELDDLTILVFDSENPYIPEKFYTYSSKRLPEEFKGMIFINQKDLIHSIRHTDERRLMGCCGPGGFDGNNRICLNNHEIGIEVGDCWGPHFVALDPNLVSQID